MQQTDVAIIGAGIIGLATAYEVTSRFPGVRCTVLDKEPEVAQHQTGHNSGVLHSGIYYKPGSLKAINCRAGKLAMEEFCRQQEIPFELCGKVIVALAESELPALQRIYERGQANGVQCEIVEGDRLRELEPHVAGIKAIHVPESGIVDYRQVCERLAECLRERDSLVMTNSRVFGMQRRGERTVLESRGGEVDAGWIVNCAGLHSDRVALMSGAPPLAKIIPFRGEYFELKPSSQHLCRNLIYPVPDPEFPFLGVHFTRMIHGGIECGPNAVFAFAREGYRRTTANPLDLAESLCYPGFIRMACKHWRAGMGEMWRSFSKRAFVSALQRLIPEIREEDLVPAPAGVRAQAVRPNGELVDDFLVERTDRIVNVINAPSPAATAALNIGRLIADKLDDDLRRR